MAEIANDAASKRERRADADGVDEHAADRRAREPQRDGPHELVERVGLRRARRRAGRRARSRRRPGRRTPRRRRRGRRARRRATARAPRSARGSRAAPTASPRATSAASITRRRSSAVGDDAAEQQERDRRDRHRDADERQRGRRVRQRVDLPRHRDQEDAVARAARRTSRSTAGGSRGGAAGSSRPHAAERRRGGRGPRSYGASARGGMSGSRRAGPGPPQELERSPRRPSAARRRSPGPSRSRGRAASSHCSEQLDALGDDLEVQRRRRATTTAVARPAVSGVASVAQERAVHLEDVDREAGSGSSATSSPCRSRPSRGARRASLSSFRRCTARSVSVIITVSVISSVRHAGSRPESASASRTSPTMSRVLELLDREVDGSSSAAGRPAAGAA